MNWKKICEIKNPLTRMAVICDRENPNLQRAFPECYEGDEGKIPWSYVMHNIDIETTPMTNGLDDILKERNIPYVELYLPSYLKGAGETPEDLKLPENHPIWKADKPHKKRLKHLGVKYVVVDASSNCFAIAIPLNAVDMKR